MELFIDISCWVVAFMGALWIMCNLNDGGALTPEDIDRIVEASNDVQPQR